MDVTISRSVFSRRRNAAPPRRAKAEEVLENVNLETYTLLRVKNGHGYNMFTERNRPIHASCSSCIANPQIAIQRNYTAMGSHSCFMLQTMGKENPFYVRMMPELWYYIRLPNVLRGRKPITTQELETAANSILEGRMYNLTGPKDESSRSLPPEVAKRFIEMFGSWEISTKVTELTTRFVNWIVGKILSFSFDGICVHNGELELIQGAMDTGLPIVFIPLHRSHLDPLLISWVLFNRGFRPPQFIAPHSLIETPILGWIAKLLGGLGCKNRKKAVESGYLKDGVNLSLLVYLHLLWSKGNSVMIPIETHRSRSGKPSTYLIGREFFNILLKLYDTKAIEDAIVIPVSVNYDTLPEEGLIIEQETSVSKPTVWQWFRRLKRNLGFVRVSFSQPFRLREFKLGHSKTESPHTYIGVDSRPLRITDKAAVTLPGTEFNWIEEYGSVTSLSSIYGETDCMEPEPSDVTRVDAIVDHGFFDALRSTVFMCTNLVAFLLLKKFKNGVDMDQLIVEFDTLEIEIRMIHKQDVGFSADETLDVIEKAVSLLGADCIQIYKVDDKIWLKPDSRRSSLMKLNYYANSLVSLFAPFAITATALVNVLPPAIWSYSGRTITRGRKFTVEESTIICKGIQIGELLKSEFLLHPPCKSLTDVVFDTIGKMKDAGHLRDGDTKSKVMYADVEDLYYDYDYDDDEFGFGRDPPTCLLIVNTSSETLEKLKFHRNLIFPYLELYETSTQLLKLLIPPPRDSPEFTTFMGVEDMCLRKHIYDGLQQNFHKGSIRNEELITMDVIRNFLRAMENMGVIKYYAGEDTKWLKTYYLVSEYETEDSLNNLSTDIFNLSFGITVDL